jgi:DNA polymerase-3 subunit epsilon
VDNSHRTLHGALLDAHLLANVYLAMTRAQNALALDDTSPGVGIVLVDLMSPDEASLPLRVVSASEEELAAHEDFMRRVAKASGGRVLWQ